MQLHGCTLAYAGLRVAPPVEDPWVAAWLLAPYTPRDEGSLRALQGRLAPDCKPRVPNVLRAGVTATCRAALLTLAVAEPAVDLLRSQGMLEVGAGAAAALSPLLASSRERGCCLVAA